MLYYALILVSVIMFGGCFAMQDVYRTKRGSGLKSSMEISCIGSIAGLIVLLIINGVAIEFSPFSLLMALWSALNGIAFTIFAFKALDRINLSLFSVFSMLGGMALPFFQGIIFYGEGFTVAKGVCIAFICAALLFTVEKGEKTKGVPFYLGIFVLNGMAGVIFKIFTATDLPKTSVASYNAWICICTAVLSATTILVLTLAQKRKNAVDTALSKKVLLQSAGIAALHGVLNKIANFFLVVALMHVESSVQYPMVTGGTMIVSTILCFFRAKKPTKRDVVSVVLSFLGMLALFLISV